MKNISFITLLAALLIALMLLAGCSTLESKNYSGKSEVTSMQSYQDFFIQNPNGVMGTVENNEARTRTFQILWIEGNRLYFCTGNHKPVYEQMKANPHVSFTSLNPDTMESVSISGTVTFVDDFIGKQRALDENLGIKKIYQSADNPIFELLYIEVSDVSSFIFSNSK